MNWYATYEKSIRPLTALTAKGRMLALPPLIHIAFTNNASSVPIIPGKLTVPTDYFA